jgi:hypothetical protein
MTIVRRQSRRTEFRGEMYGIPSAFVFEAGEPQLEQARRGSG